MDERDSTSGASLSEEAQCGGPLGTPKDMLSKALDTGISLHMSPFTFEGNLESGGGSYIGDFV
jgi:hypothetical protein